MAQAPILVPDDGPASLEGNEIPSQKAEGIRYRISRLLGEGGMGSAFLHRAPETANEDEAAAVHLTLRLVLTAIWAAALIGLSLLFAQGELRLALIALTVIFAGLYLTDTPKVILARRVQHRRLAVLDLLCAVATTIVALVLARREFELIALLATDAVTLALTVPRTGTRLHAPDGTTIEVVDSTARRVRMVRVHHRSRLATRQDRAG